MPATANTPLARHREQRRAAGLKLKQIWVPDTRAPGFADELARQCQAVASSDTEALAFADAALASIDGWH